MSEQKNVNFMVIHSIKYEHVSLLMNSYHYLAISHLDSYAECRLFK